MGGIAHLFAFLSHLFAFLLAAVLVGCSGPFETRGVEPPEARFGAATETPALLSVVYVDALGRAGNGNGAFQRPAGLAIDVSDALYVADSGNHRVQVFRSDGTYQESIGAYGWRVGGFDLPVAVAVSRFPQPLLFVAERGNHRIQVCDLVRGQFRVALDETQVSPMEVSSLAVGRQGELYAAPVADHYVAKLNAQGAVEWKRGGLGTASDRFRQPLGVGVDSAGNILIADTGNERLVQLDYTGNPVAVWGEGSGLERPSALARDAYDRWYVCDRRDIAVFDRAGKFLLRFGRGELSEPAGIAVSRSGIVAVSDAGTHQVQRFRIVNAEK